MLTGHRVHADRGRAVLSATGLTRTFGGGGGVEGLDLEVAPGEVVALVGLNGAGKTTLLRLLLGMLTPQAGEVRLLGEPLNRLPRRRFAEIGHGVGAAPYPELTVREQLRVAALLHDHDPACIPTTLTEWDLEPYADRRCRRLSTGNRQRVMLAGALQHAPRLVVLDEPTAALDPAAVIRLRDHLQARSAAGAAVLVSSHHLDEVARIADRILVLHGGRFVGTLDPAGVDLERAFFALVHAHDRTREDPR